MELIQEFELLFNRRISSLEEIDSIELVVFVNTINDKYFKNIDMFSVIECKGLIELNDLFFK